jgi:glutathione S-transferase
MILYYSPQTRAFPVLWTLEELGVEYELKIIDLKLGAQKKGEYRRLNPMMKVPTLTDGHVVVTETGAILQYIAEKSPSPCLLPQIGDTTRPTCLRWLFFVGSNLEPAMGKRFNGWTPNPYYNGWGDFDRVRDVIAEILSVGPWLLGGRFSIADIYLASDLRIARAGELIAADIEPFASYLHRIGSRPAFLRAMKIDSDLAS